MNHPKILNLCQGAYKQVVCRGMVEEQRNVLEIHWPLDRLVINKSHGPNRMVVLRIRPHTSEMENINNLTLQGALRRQCQTQMLHSISQCALEGIGSCSANTWIKNMACERKQTQIVFQHCPSLKVKPNPLYNDLRQHSSSQCKNTYLPPISATSDAYSAKPINFRTTCFRERLIYSTRAFE